MARATMAIASYAPTATQTIGHGGAAMKQTDLDRRVVAHLRRLVHTRFRSGYRLAQAAKVAPSTLYKMFAGDRGVGIDVLKALHDNLGISADVFLDDDPPQQFWKPGPNENRRGRRPDGEPQVLDPTPARRQGSGR